MSAFLRVADFDAQRSVTAVIKFADVGCWDRPSIDLQPFAFCRDRLKAAVSLMAFRARSRHAAQILWQKRTWWRSGRAHSEWNRSKRRPFSGAITGSTSKFLSWLPLRRPARSRSASGKPPALSRVVSDMARDRNELSGVQTIEVAGHHYRMPERRSDGSDADDTGAWPEIGLLGTKLCPRKKMIALPRRQICRHHDVEQRRLRPLR
ncbi:hypothetical protein HYPP_04072 [Hyphomicrobium sp. ghe19]|nr:hypothetical protein HYPP_04072 [Hyphomicrobium sp. ghe19]